MALFKILIHALEIVITISICIVFLAFASVIGVLEVLQCPRTCKLDHRSQRLWSNPQMPEAHVI